MQHRRENQFTIHKHLLGIIMTTNAMSGSSNKRKKSEEDSRKKELLTKAEAKGYKRLKNKTIRRKLS